MNKKDLYNQLLYRMLRFSCLLIIYLLVACTSGSSVAPPQTESQEPIQAFRQEIGRLRKELKIPGLSVAVLKNKQVIFAEGIGCADIENKVLATANTPYNIASLSKTFAAAVLMKLVEDNLLNLDTAMADILEDTLFPYGAYSTRGFANACSKIKEVSRDPDLKYVYLLKNYRCDTEKITVRHHFTHTSQGIPGETYCYNGFLFGFLSLVAEEVSGKSYAQLLVENIIEPLDMTRTVPSISDELRDQIFAERAKYYRNGFLGNYVPSSYPVKLSSSAGMVSTVLDLAKFDVAMDQNLIVSKVSKEAMFTPTISNSGYALPYGLGWFVQEHRGVQLIWHYGYAPKAYSSLILKIPQEEVTLILLANSDGASAPFNLGAGDVLRSPFAVTFINLFTNIEAKLNSIPVAGIIHHVHAPENEFNTHIEVVIKKHFTGSLPDAIDSITVTGPGGELPISKDDFTYLPQWRDFWIEIPGAPQIGTYTFTLTSGSKIGSAKDTQLVIRKMPIPDASTFSPADREILDTKIPTFSWKPVRAEIPIYYRLEINNLDGGRVYATERVEGMLSHTIPEGIVKPGQAYMWRVRAVDGSDWGRVQNRSHSEWRRFTMAKSLK